jgi:hypothetical protein
METPYGYKAGSSAASNFLFKEEFDALIADGKMFDTVADIGPLYKMGADNYSTCLKKWESMAACGRDGNTTEEIIDNFMDTVLARTPKPLDQRWFAIWNSVILNKQPGKYDDKRFLKL